MSLLPAKLRLCKYVGDSGYRNCSSSDLTTLQPSGSILGMCSNLVRSISYIFKYTNPNGFTDVELDVEFFNADQTSTSMKQFFQINFLPSSFNLVRSNFYFYEVLNWINKIYLHTIRRQTHCPYQNWWIVWAGILAIKLVKQYKWFPTWIKLSIAFEFYF